jgi:hypothetical protein
MPGYAPKVVLAPFPPAITEAEARAASSHHERKYIIEKLIEASSFLIKLNGETNIFGRNKNDPYKASLKTLHDRLHAGRPAISPVPKFAKNASRLRAVIALRARDPPEVNSRPLEDFEDLYYASLARMLDMMHTLNVRVASGFNEVTEKLYANGPTIADAHAMLTKQWITLNDPALVRPIDEAVRWCRYETVYEAITTDYEAGNFTREQADSLIEELHNQPDKPGIAWLGAWSPAMIGAWLEEKYRILLQVEKDEHERQIKENHERLAKQKEERRVKDKQESLLKDMHQREMLMRTKVNKTTKSTRSLRSLIKRPSVDKAMNSLEAHLDKAINDLEAHLDQLQVSDGRKSVQSDEQYGRPQWNSKQRYAACPVPRWVIPQEDQVYYKDTHLEIFEKVHIDKVGMSRVPLYLRIQNQSVMEQERRQLSQQLHIRLAEYKRIEDERVRIEEERIRIAEEKAWELRIARVAEYQQYLRRKASPAARQHMSATINNARRVHSGETEGYDADGDYKMGV